MPPPAAAGALKDLQEVRPAHSAKGAPPQVRAVGAHSGTDGSALPADVMREIDDIVHYLAVESVVAAELGKPQSPVSDVWEKLETIDSMRRKLGDAQLGALRKRLSDAIDGSSHSCEDAEVLRKVVSAITQQTGGASLRRVMADITFDRLQLPDLDLDPTGRTVPDSRYFNSALVPLAEVAYDHDPVGRTLLWNGACRLFPGAGRRERLRSAMFSLPKDSGLTSAMDFYLAVDALKLDEPVTDEMIEDMRRKADGS